MKFHIKCAYSPASMCPTGPKVSDCSEGSGRLEARDPFSPHPAVHCRHVCETGLLLFSKKQKDKKNYFHSYLSSFQESAFFFFSCVEHTSGRRQPSATTEWTFLPNLALSVFASRWWPSLENLLVVPRV